MLRRPELDAPERLAMEAWHFMGGWDPLRLDAVVQWFDVEDPERLIMGLLAIRDEINKAQ